MKKVFLSALLVASSTAQASIYDCEYTAPNGFIVKNNQLAVVVLDDGAGTMYFNNKTYPFQSMKEAADGAYATTGDSSLSVTKTDDKGYELNVTYKDAERTQELTCSIDQTTLAAIRKEEAESNKTPEQKVAETKARKEAADRALQAKKLAAENAARAKKQAAEKAAAGAGVDDLLGDVSGGKNTPRQKQPISSGSSGVDISAYSAQIQMAIRNKIEGLDSYAGERCTLHIAMSSDGTIQSVQSEGGDEGLCNAAITGVRKAGSLPKPPSQAVYNIFKDFRIDFKP
ncbi:cell envelope integrity protein TolA [Citrobacter portucalensis]|uniref:cell envelope integrity protein TolA n=1 Tax=Citrobacter portucalensis TaxID=1639133 RepID=UPI003BF4F49E